MAGFGKIDQVVSNTAELSAAAAASGSKDTVKITVDEAKKTAIDDAGAKEKDVTLKKAGLTTDDGIVKYEVEFYYKDFEYEYDIDPGSGKITDCDKEAMDSEDYAKMKLLQERASDKESDKSAEKPAEKPSDKSSKENKVYILTIKDAQKIAYDDAGVKEKDIVLKKAVLTTDDGTDMYEVEFYYNDFEYEYDIDPKTGIITDLDRDPMDAEDRAKMEALKKKGSEKSTDKTGTISLDDAKKTALDDAGVKEADVVMKKAELSADDGKNKYEIEFYYKDIEYEYDIDAKTGAVTDLDRDPMDAEDYTEMKALQKKDEKETSANTGSVNADKAFEIAIAHAKVSAADTKKKEVKLDYDDDLGKEVFEVEFKAGGKEYSYDIDPETGNILQYESEIDD